jgi:enoyl-CoA hydratase/carnithine racemase
LFCIGAAVLTEFVSFSEADGVATITFTHPEILNALGLEEIAAIDSQLRRWRGDSRISGVILRGDGFRAFSVGENLKEVDQALKTGDDAYLASLARSTHRLVQLWATYPKPTMAIMNGITMGLGAALGIASAFRVVTELTLFSVPHSRFGLLPDAGTAFYLAKCPGKIGLFLALTGMEIRAPGMLHAGLGSHYVQPQHVDAVTFNNVETISLPMNERPLATIQPEIDRCFGQRTVREIETVLSFRPERGFRDILGQMKQGEPLAAALTHRHINEVANRSLDEILQESYRLNRRLMALGNVREAIRARLTDRDGKPAWVASSPDDLDSHFAPLTTEAELYFDKI